MTHKAEQIPSNLQSCRTLYFTLEQLRKKGYVFRTVGPPAPVRAAAARYFTLRRKRGRGSSGKPSNCRYPSGARYPPRNRNQHEGAWRKTGRLNGTAGPAAYIGKKNYTISAGRSFYNMTAVAIMPDRVENDEEAVRPLLEILPDEAHRPARRLTERFIRDHPDSRTSVRMLEILDEGK